MVGERGRGAKYPTKRRTDPSHSVRRATVGSTRVARRAGT